MDLFSILFLIAYTVLIITAPIVGFAILDLLNCIRENKPFWLPSKVIVVLFFWGMGWAALLGGSVVTTVP